jgi:predicted permease
MEAVLGAVAPFFAVVGLGALAGRRGIVPVEGAAVLNAFVFRFALPALLVRALWTLDVAAAFDWRFVAAWAGCGLGLYAAAALALRAGFGPGEGPGRGAVRAQGSVIGNIGFLGVPLAFALIGPQAAGPLAMALLVDLTLVIPLSIAWLEAARGRDGAGSALSVAGRALGRGVTNPFFLSIAAGAALSAAGAPLPVALDRGLAFLGGAAGPAALFSLGLTLAGNPGVRRLAEAAAVSALKLLAHPAAVWAAMGALGVEGPALAAAVTLAALPVATNVFVVAQGFGVGAKLAADAVTLSTAASVVTLSALAAWVG